MGSFTSETLYLSFACLTDVKSEQKANYFQVKCTTPLDLGFVNIEYNCNSKQQIM